MSEKLPMNIYRKLLEIQKNVDKIVKDGKNTNDNYDYVSGSRVLEIIRPMMNELGLLLIPEVTGSETLEGQTKSGTARFVMIMHYVFTWVDVETGEQFPVLFEASGADLGSPERAVGKAASYAEKYFLLKTFHIPTDKDDPDNGGRTKSGELRQSGTAAAKETAEYYRKALRQIVSAICGDDAEKEKVCYLSWTKSDARGYAGVDNLAAVSDAALPVVYAKGKKQYESRLKKPFELLIEEE